ncbi:MAG: alpha/beta hydrolase [Desulfopila sp.]
MKESRWSYAPSPHCRGVVLISHGLNQRPSSWQQLTEHVNQLGLHVYRLALSGHRGRGFDDMLQVNASLWEEEFRAAYQEIARRFADKPHYLLGFSLGCLLALTVQLKDQRRYFSRQLLLAPAIAVQPYTRLVLLLCNFVDRLPSRSPKQYVANHQGTSAAAYRALFDLLHDFKRFSDLGLIDVPTLVAMRSDDELVSYRAIQRCIRRFGLDNWQTVRLNQPGSWLDRWRTFTHLIVDSHCAGEEVWNRLVLAVEAFLSADERELLNSSSAAPLAERGGRTSA